MEDLSDLLQPLLDETDVPSVAAAVAFGPEVHAAGAVGVRKRGDPTPVSVNDKYHIGSCAKAMTATLAGILVERGVLSWQKQLGEVFPNLEIHPGYRPATLKQLLSHTAGMPGNKFTESEGYDDDEEDDMPDGLTPTEERAYLVPDLLKRRPPYAPGEVYDYANVGYSVAGAVLKQLTQTPFVTLIRHELFTPLGMISAGFGAAGTPGQVDEPWGHDPAPVEPGPEADNPIYMSPAGTIHMTITDFAKHAAFHLTGEPRLLKRKTLEVLHTPVLEDYALGWGVSESEWAGEPAWHVPGPTPVHMPLRAWHSSKIRLFCASPIKLVRVATPLAERFSENSSSVSYRKSRAHNPAFRCIKLSSTCQFTRCALSAPALATLQQQGDLV